MCDMGAIMWRMTDVYATWARLCTSAACGVPYHKSYVIRQILRNRKNNLTINCKDNLLWIFNELIFNEIKIFEKVDFSNSFCCIFAASNFKLIDMENTDPILEARRYVANASEIIEKSVYDSETNLYRDKKYVRIAGNTLWSGCLIALEAVLQIRKGKGRPSIEKYKEAAGKRDRTLLKYVNAGYETMHLFMGYDGSKERKICDAGFERANDIIDRCSVLMPKTALAS